MSSTLLITVVIPVVVTVLTYPLLVLRGRSMGKAGGSADSATGTRSLGAWAEEAGWLSLYAFAVWAGTYVIAGYVSFTILVLFGVNISAGMG